MEIHSSYWKVKSKKYLKRRIGNKGKPKDVFLIVCEGEKTEPLYFGSFRLPKRIITVAGIGDHTENLVKKAIKYRKDAAKYGIKFDQTWCVFDKDSFPPNNFDNAIRIAEKEDINVAYSNEAFELWYLLHFSYMQARISRRDYQLKLSTLLGRRYKKNDKVLYDELVDKQETAIRNAERLLLIHTCSRCSEKNPSTTVHLLVKELNKFL